MLTDNYIAALAALAPLAALAALAPLAALAALACETLYFPDYSDVLTRKLSAVRGIRYGFSSELGLSFHHSGGV